MAQMTKKGARQVTADLDKIAELFQTEWKTLGIPQHIALDFAKRCDMLSDAVEKNAGIEREALSGLDPVDESKTGWDPEQIGEEKAGPLVDEPDEPFMNQQFSQQENRELRERQQGGDLGTTPVEDEQTPTPGVQASFRDLVAALKGGDFDQTRVAQALGLAVQVVKQSKKKLPPEFLENAKKKKEESENKDEEKEATKKASAHGYDLFK